MYTKDVNKIKNNFSTEEFFEMVKDIAEWHGLTEGDRL